MATWDATVDTSAPPSGTGCVECEAQDTWWFHLRRCAACGHIGCCDDSLGKHATAHAESTRHRFMASFEPGEDWSWDFEADDYADLPPLAPPVAHPTSQTTPGPADRVPDDWEQQLLAQQS